jgi:hypothetical protein
MATASGNSGWADVAQLVEHSLGKGEVTSSILVIGSMKLKRWKKELKWKGLGKGMASAVPHLRRARAAFAAEVRAGVTQW